MLVQTTYPDKKIIEQINLAVGNSFSFIQILKIGSIGSQRMKVTENSPTFTPIITKDFNAVWANISLRPKGIIVIINSRLSQYSWIIPFYKLSIIKSNELVIHAEGEFLKLAIESDASISRFVSKIISRKNQFQSQMISSSQ